MNVWIRKARKKATCHYDGCKEPEKAITNGTYYVVCSWYMNTRSGKNWLKQMAFHPRCWLERAIAELEKRVVLETRGRSRMAITDPDRAARLKLLRKRASISQRLKNATDKGNYSLAARLVEKLEHCKVEITPYGGIPEKW